MEAGWIETSKMPDFDGRYLCNVLKNEECGAVNEYQQVIDCIMNEWRLDKGETVTHWHTTIPSPKLNHYIMTTYEKQTAKYALGEDVYLLDKELYNQPKWIKGEVTEVGSETVCIKWEDLPDDTEYDLSDMPDIKFTKPIYTV